ncbi:MAG: peptidoglycan DD-metalloendopeptidase family protein [Clostridia bacterium]|nr:peptidoglycan DD-metalloendopeptidase family protein [Clostridia bacterium]
MLAAKAGTVEKVCHSNIGYGNHVIIKHDNKTKTLYATAKTLK